MSNRAERRRKERENRKSPTYCYNEEQLKAKIEEAVMKQKENIVPEVVDKVLNQYLVLTMGVLYDKFDFTPEQLKEYKDRLEFLSECINEDYATVEDYKLILKEEANIVFEENGDKTIDDSIGKVDAYKQKMLKLHKWYIVLCVLKTLRDFGFARKRGNEFLEVLNCYLQKGSDFNTFCEWERELYTGKMFKEGIDKYDLYYKGDD